MGLAIVGTDLPVLKQNNAILAFTADDAVLKPETDCIRCGRCVAACPMSLMPTNIVKAAKIKDVDALKRAGVTVCMECGSCAFACPARHSARTSRRSISPPPRWRRRQAHPLSPT